jgi:hypothetical protein
MALAFLSLLLLAGAAAVSPTIETSNGVMYVKGKVTNYLFTCSIARFVPLFVVCFALGEFLIRR